MSHTAFSGYRTWNGGSFILVRVVLTACLLLAAGATVAGSVENLAAPHDGRSRRETSTARLPNGDFDPNSNRDNSNVKPGQTKVLADLKGPGEITHIWMTFLGPEPHPWA